MLESTFQLGGVLGPARERRLWRAGIVRWCELPTGLLPAATDRRLRAAIDLAARASQMGDVAGLASLIPPCEHWRLFAAFGDDAAYLDIETGDDGDISAIGLCDRRGVRLLLRDIAAFPEIAAGWKLLVTFNGLSFDVPILRRAFPDWRPPCHIDLRHVLARAGQHGGLKAIERRLGLRRPPHLDRIDGWGACFLYRQGREGDREALRRFAEYNLYDAVGLRTLMAWSFNRLVEEEAADAPSVRAAVLPLPVPERGDVLYDVSKILLAI
jgi:hypothetical protein